MREILTSGGRALAADVLLAAILASLVVFDPATTSWQAAWTAPLVAAAMLLRRRRPVWVLAVMTTVVVTALLLGMPMMGGPYLALGALTYSAALYSERRRPWLYALLCWAALSLTGSILDFSAWWSPDQFGLFAWILGGAGAGDSIRMRRAYIAEVMERARQAEQTREEEARRRVIDERLRIARELHDVVAHHIAVISVHAGAAGHALRDQPEKVWPVLGHIRDAADTVLDEIKSVISVLRDPSEVPSTEPTPGLDRLPDLLDGLRAAGFEVRQRQEGTARPLPAVADLAAYRIVQEALTNAHRYGDGSATLRIAYLPGEVLVEVTNRIGGGLRDGPAGAGPNRPAAGGAGGLDRPVGSGAGSGTGFGLLGMRERATAVHGRISAGPIAGGSFRVHAVLPADEHAVRWTAETETVGTFR